MLPDDVVMSFKLALLVPGRRTPFAVMTLLGALLAAYGLLRLFSAGETLGKDDRFDYARKGFKKFLPKSHLSPEELRSELSLLENGYALFLAGAVLIALGAIPFVTGRE